jgi:ribonuclease Z
VQAAWKEDVRERLEGDEPAVEGGWRLDALEVGPGFSLEEEEASVEAFGVRHGGMDALGWRVSGRGGTVVVSGDTAPFPGMDEAYAGADVLVHEAYSETGLSRRREDWRRYHSGAHMPARELGSVAAKVRPGLLVLTHVLTHGAPEEVVLDEVRRGGWKGPAVLGRDLAAFAVPPGRPGS